MKYRVIKKLLSLTLVISLITVMQEKVYSIDPSHIIDGYEKYEPLFVHTPVISPVTIKDDEGNTIPDNGKGHTELISEDEDAWYQLRLDTDYIMHWDSMTHREILGYGDSGDPSKYDKYTQDKWMKFPFEVLYNGTFYELESDGYTDWIQIKRPSSWTDTENNHWLDTPIYIPSYASELTEDKYIYYKVEAINVDGDLAEHYREEQEKGNTSFDLVIADDGAKYVATYKIPVQLSGWLYDFTITGTTNADIYTGDTEGSSTIAFSNTKTEKKSGIYNRIGGTALRYLVDGTLNNSWNELYTVPLTNGKSEVLGGEGAVWKGQTVSFSLKTMSNMWDDNGNKDRIEIIPTFTYVDNSGNVLDSSEIKVLYDNPDGSGTYIEYGSTKDTISSNWTKTCIGSDMQDGAYYTEAMTDTENGGSADKYHFGDWATFTAEEYNKEHSLTGDDEYTADNILNSYHSSYCLSHIILNPSLRLLSGEWEELSWNIEDTGKEYDEVLRYCDLDGDDLEDSGWSEDYSERFRKSIQTWYGEYHIPENLYVVNLNDYPDFEIESYMTTASEGLGITAEDEAFLEGGYLIVNFDIYAYMDGDAHLKYIASSDDGNMWNIEGYSNTPSTSDTTPITSYEDGDVLVIDLDKSVTNKYTSGIYNIN